MRRFWVIVATGLVTNLRFVIYSAAMRPYFAHLAGAAARRARLLHDGFHVHAVHALRAGRQAARSIATPGSPGVCTNNWITWQVSAATGIVAASYVPTEWGLEFTGTLALVALVGPSLVTRPALLGALVAAAVALLAHGLPFKLGLFCGAIAGIAAATLADSLAAARAASGSAEGA